MQTVFPCLRRHASSLLLAIAFCGVSTQASGQDNPSAKAKDLYDRIKTFTLSGAVPVKELALIRDRAQLILNGTIYFAAPVEGRVTGAVFIGEGRFIAAPPPSEFEKGNLKRGHNRRSA